MSINERNELITHINGFDLTSNKTKQVGNDLLKSINEATHNVFEMGASKEEDNMDQEEEEEEVEKQQEKSQQLGEYLLKEHKRELQQDVFRNNSKKQNKRKKKSMTRGAGYMDRLKNKQKKKISKSNLGKKKKILR